MSAASRLAAAAVLLSAGCAEMPARPADEGPRRVIVVEAEGWAPLLAGESLPTARQRALAEAQKKAVEKAVGVTVRASTRVDDAVNVRQSIVANMGGTIRRYEVLSEGARDGAFRVLIRADVLYVPAPSAAKPRTARFFIRIPDAAVAEAVRAALVSSDAALSEGERDADVVVTGTVETYGLADPRLGGLYSYRARLSLKAADVRAGRVTDASYEGSSIDLDEAAALQGAREKAGRDAGLALAGLLPPGTEVSAAFP